MYLKLSTVTQFRACICTFNYVAAELSPEGQCFNFSCSLSQTGVPGWILWGPREVVPLKRVCSTSQVTVLAYPTGKSILVGLVEKAPGYSR